MIRKTSLVPFASLTRDGAPAAFLSPAAKATPLSPACDTHRGQARELPNGSLPAG